MGEILLSVKNYFSIPKRQIQNPAVSTDMSQDNAFKNTWRNESDKRKKRTNISSGCDFPATSL